MFDKYVIKNGDNLDLIAEKFATDKQYLKDINNIVYEDLIRAGLEIIVPKNKEKYFEFYKIEQGDNLLQVAKKYNINPELLVAMNGLDIDDYIYPDQEILIPKSGYSYYISKEGDTLDTVAATFSSCIEDMIDHNELIYLLPGQLLVSKRS